MRKLKNEELGRISGEMFRSSEKINACIVLDDVRSAMNVGSAFRTGDAFRIEKIYLCGITAHPPHREINKTALGAQDTVAWEHVENSSELIKRLKTEGVEVVVIEQADESTSLSDFVPDPAKKYAFVFGNEVHGVADEVVAAADRVVEIPQFGTKHSLNVSVSIGVILWDLIAKTAPFGG